MFAGNLAQFLVFMCLWWLFEKRLSWISTFPYFMQRPFSRLRWLREKNRYFCVMIWNKSTVWITSSISFSRFSVQNRCKILKLMSELLWNICFTLVTGIWREGIWAKKKKRSLGMCHYLTTFEITRLDWSPLDLPFRGFSWRPWNRYS